MKKGSGHTHPLTLCVRVRKLGLRGAGSFGLSRRSSVLDFLSGAPLTGSLQLALMVAPVWLDPDHWSGNFDWFKIPVQRVESTGPKQLVTWSGGTDGQNIDQRSALVKDFSVIREGRDALKMHLIYLPQFNHYLLSTIVQFIRILECVCVCLCVVCRSVYMHSCEAFFLKACSFKPTPVCIYEHNALCRMSSHFGRKRRRRRIEMTRRVCATQM